jgi:hypothetical protein
MKNGIKHNESSNVIKQDGIKHNASSNVIKQDGIKHNASSDVIKQDGIKHNASSNVIKQDRINALILFHILKVIFFFFSNLLNIKNSVNNFIMSRFYHI